MEKYLDYDGIDIKGLYYKKEKPANCQKPKIGTKRDLLTAISPVTILNEEIKTKKGWWLFKCDCGNFICRLISSTRGSGRVQSCGCYRKQQLDKKYIGKKFNRLTVIERDDDYKIINNIKSYYPYYKCKCDCGNYVTVRSNTLAAGEVKSCGCLKKEQEEYNLVHGFNFIDLTGQVFYWLTVIKRTGTTKDGDTLWDCLCKCGHKVTVRRSSLRNGKAKSCGCLKMSFGELKIKEILEKNNIEYYFDYPYFKDLINDKNGILRYDFVLIKDNKPFRLIEFDGTQHYKSVDYFGGERKFKEQQENDKIKNEYAQKMNLPLIRIPYDKVNQITLENLFNDTF